MSVFLYIAIAVAAIVVLLVLAVGIAASRPRRQTSTRRAELLDLAKLRSPSGKPFFPREDSALELAELLDDVDERRRRENER